MKQEIKIRKTQLSKYYAGKSDDQDLPLHFGILCLLWLENWDMMWF